MQIGVYGLGRFGSFWASLLARYPYKDSTVVAYSRSKHTTPFGVKAVSEDEVLSSDIIYFCVTISAFEAVLQSVKDKIKEGAIILDTCSVKTYPAKWMCDAFDKEKYHLIATHPMFGPDSAKNGISGLPIVLCPLSEKDKEYEDLKEYFKSIKLDVLEMSPRHHDKEAAYSQGVTHFVGRTLDSLGMRPTPIATQGYRTLMTIVEQTCNDPIRLFYDLQRYNPYAKEMRLSLQVSIEKVLNTLLEQEEEE